MNNYSIQANTAHYKSQAPGMKESCLVDYTRRKAAVDDTTELRPRNSSPRSVMKRRSSLINITVKTIAPMEDKSLRIDIFGKETTGTSILPRPKLVVRKRSNSFCHRTSTAKPEMEERLGGSLGTLDLFDDEELPPIQFRVRRSSFMRRFSLNNSTSNHSLDNSSLHNSLSIHSSSSHGSRRDVSRGRSPRATRRSSVAGSLVPPPKYWMQPSHGNTSCPSLIGLDVEAPQHRRSSMGAMQRSNHRLSLTNHLTSSLDNSWHTGLVNDEARPPKAARRSSACGSLTQHNHGSAKSCPSLAGFHTSQDSQNDVSRKEARQQRRRRSPRKSQKSNQENSWHRLVGDAAWRSSETTHFLTGSRIRRHGSDRHLAN